MWFEGFLSTKKAEKKPSYACWECSWKRAHSCKCAILLQTWIWTMFKCLLHLGHEPAYVVYIDIWINISLNVYLFFFLPFSDEMGRFCPPGHFLDRVGDYVQQHYVWGIMSGGILFYTHHYHHHQQPRRRRHHHHHQQQQQRHRCHLCYLDLSSSLKVICDGAIRLPIYSFLLVFNSNIWPNRVPLHDTNLLQILSGIEFDILKVIQSENNGTIGLPIYDFPSMSNNTTCLSLSVQLFR